MRRNRRPVDTGAPTGVEERLVDLSASELVALAQVVGDDVVLVARANGSGPWTTTWHAPECPDGRGRAVAAPLAEHPAVNGTLLCRCGSLVQVPGPNGAQRLAVHLGNLTNYSSVKLAVERAEHSPAGSVAQWAAVADARSALERTGTGTGRGGEELEAWKDRVEERLRAAGRVDDRRLAADLMTFVGLDGEEGTKVPPHVVETWRRHVLAGRKGYMLRWAMSDAMAGRPEKWAFFGDTPPVVEPGAWRGTLWTMTGSVRSWLWVGRLEALADRAVQDWDGTETVVMLPPVRKYAWPPDKNGCAVRERWGGGDVVAVPATAAGAVARALGGQVLGEGDGSCAELVAELVHRGTPPDEAYLAASVATT